MKQFYSAGLLFDVLNCFGELSEDVGFCYVSIYLILDFFNVFRVYKLVVKKQYAKRKAMYLNKCFQTGETPIPGPLVDGKESMIKFYRFNIGYKFTSFQRWHG